MLSLELYQTALFSKIYFESQYVIEIFTGFYISIYSTVLNVIVKEFILNLCSYIVHFKVLPSSKCVKKSLKLKLLYQAVLLYLMAKITANMVFFLLCSSFEVENITNSFVAFLFNHIYKCNLQIFIFLPFNLWLEYIDSHWQLTLFFLQCGKLCQDCMLQCILVNF